MAQNIRICSSKRERISIMRNEIERRFSDYDVSLYKRERERTFEDNVHCFANSRMNSPVQKREDEASHITK